MKDKGRLFGNRRKKIERRSEDDRRELQEKNSKLRKGKK